MNVQSAEKRVNLVGMILPSGQQAEAAGRYSLILNVPGDADYPLSDLSAQPLREWVYERVYVAGRLGEGDHPALIVDRLEVLNEQDEDYWDDDGY